MRACLLSISILLASSHMVAAQQNWHLKTMLGIGADAEMFYGGPVLQIGTGYHLGQRFSLDAEYLGHFSWKNSPPFDPTLTARWQQHSLAVLPTFYFGRQPKRGFYMGAGPVLQVRNEIFSNAFERTNNELNVVTMALRMGTSISSGKNGSWVFETFFTGPLMERYSNGFGIEILTQLSLTIGYRFHLGSKGP